MNKKGTCGKHVHEWQREVNHVFSGATKNQKTLNQKLGNSKSFVSFIATGNKWDKQLFKIQNWYFYRGRKKSEFSELSFENAVEGILKSFLPNLNQSQDVVYYQDTEYCKEEKSSRTFLM